jgi:hypothetical protein
LAEDRGEGVREQTIVIPEAAERLSGIHNPGARRYRKHWEYGFRVRALRAPEG